MEHLKRGKQLEILRELVRQVDEGVNVDAGIMYKNPTSVYACPDLAAQEWEVMFRNQPQMIGLTADLPEPGSFITTDDFGTPVLATRDSKGHFRAFLNTCRHRASRLSDKARGTSQKFVCPFHNWTYSTDGRLMGIPQAKHFGEIDKSCHGLIELPSEEKYGFLFVHPQPDGKLDVDSLLGDLAPEIAQQRFDEGIVYQAETVIDKRLNWKLANDTFGETYHFGKLHRETLGQVFVSDVLHYETFGRNHRFVLGAVGLHQLKSIPEEQWKFFQATNPLYYLYPNVQLVYTDSSIDLVRIYPHPKDPGRSITRIGHYATIEALEVAQNLKDAGVRLDGDVYDPDNNSFFDFDDSDTAYDGPMPYLLEASKEVFASTIEEQDYLMGEHQQAAAENGALDHIVFGRNEPALHHYHRTFREVLGMPPLEEFSSEKRA